MLKIIIGRAKSGKTAMVMQEIKQRADQGQEDIKLIVPEQYSHDAERELCRACGDSMSLYAEVISFTRLSRRIADMVGGTRRFLTDSGRALALNKALDSVCSRLKVYGPARRSPELQQVLLGAISELKLAHVTPERLAQEAQLGNSALHDKLEDLSLILAAYDAVAARGELDPDDRLLSTAESLEKNPQLQLGAYYIDGFTDFTAAEREVVSQLARRCRDLTLCLTMEDLYEENEVFESSRRTALWFKELAESRGEKLEIVRAHRENDSPIGIFEKYLFGYTNEKFDGQNAISLYRADSISQECELAAAKAAELVREGCRWRDIAVAVRGFESYRSQLEHAFEQYGIPLYVAARADVMQKPLPLMLSSALDAATGGYEYEDMFACLKTGLAGISKEECDQLENYCILWSIRGRSWTNEWTNHPDGYDKEFDEACNRRLAYLNKLRKKVIVPLENLRTRGKEAKTLAQQAQAVARYFEEARLPHNLQHRAELLEEKGESALAAEYSQLWDVAVDALEQAVLVLGESEMTLEEFGRLYKLMLSQCDVGSIPVSLDRVSAGEMDRMRRRSIKHLIVLGASDQRLPRISEQGGVFSMEERRQLHEMGLELGGTAELDLEREMNIIYNCVTLPAESLLLSYCPVGDEGAAALPSFVMKRAQALFDIDIAPCDSTELLGWSRAGAWLLAARGMRGEDGIYAAAHEYFRQQGETDELERLRLAAEADRGSLSAESVKSLYGEKIRLSASRVDKFASCRFAFFMQYGLKAKPRQPAGFDPPQLGTFMHYVLEKVARELSENGGFKDAKRDKVEALCDKYVEEYVHTKLNDFNDRTERFIYLFRRLNTTVRAVVWDMVEELSRSDFEPLDFELSFSGDGEQALPIGDDALMIGVADRVDGCVIDGKLHLRVMDYKTGHKSFDLSDVLQGRDLQMLMYLFALAERGKERYGKEIVPSGVLYVPARNSMVAADSDLADDEIAAIQGKEKRRSGLVLNQPKVLEAMEHGQDTKYIPVTFKKGVPSGDSLATAEQLGCISRFLDNLLKEMASQLKSGSIDADPYYRNGQDNACQWCDYKDACYFNENTDKRNYVVRVKNEKALAIMAEKEAKNG